MSLFSLFSRRRSTPAPRKPASVRLRLESLEGRDVPSALALGDLNLAVPAALVAAHASTAEHSAPWKLQAEGAVVGVNEDASFTIEWTGTSTLLGHYTATASMVVSGDGLTLSGSGSYTAANGDQLSFTYTTHPDYPLGSQWPNPGHGTALITGGTGRFANASGGVDYSGVLNEDFTFTFSHDDGQQLNW
ncbi:MAG: hypothetical protein L0Z62_38715 [Gemmataceae bacterium]|nr:hypothetical protein [Gemmataceae bacterium]